MGNWEEKKKEEKKEKKKMNNWKENTLKLLYFQQILLW